MRKIQLSTEVIYGVAQTSAGAFELAILRGLRLPVAGERDEIRWAELGKGRQIIAALVEDATQKSYRRER